MNEPRRTGIKILLFAFILGLWGDILFFPHQWGLNLFLWYAALWGIATLLVRQEKLPDANAVIGLTGLAALCTAGVVWRDSEALLVLDQLLAAALLGICAWRAQGGAPTAATIGRWFLGIFGGFAQIAAGLIHLVFRDIEWQGKSTQGWRRQLPAVLTGAVIAIPFIVVFTSLFVSADTNFKGWFDKLFDWNFESVMEHGVMILFCTAIGAGYLRAILFKRILLPSLSVQPMKPRTAVVEVTTALSLISLLFLAFVLVQLNAMFAGDTWVQTTPDVTYSSNARRGFFELLAVSCLVLPMLLGAHHLVADAPNKRVVNGVSGVLIVLLGVIMASALQRMHLYVDNYGLTEQRFYATTFMLWLAGVFVWLTLTVLRNRAERFCIGAVAWALVTVGGLHIINPDDFIVRINLAQQQEDKELDPEYLTSLSADAIPRLRRAVDSLPTEAQTQVREFLESRSADTKQTDWRTWNLARQRARTELSAMR